MISSGDRQQHQYSFSNILFFFTMALRITENIVVCTLIGRDVASHSCSPSTGLGLGTDVSSVFAAKHAASGVAATLVCLQQAL